MKNIIVVGKVISTGTTRIEDIQRAQPEHIISVEDCHEIHVSTITKGSHIIWIQK